MTRKKTTPSKSPRGRSPSRAGVKNAAANNTGLLKIIIALLVVVIAVFGYFLYQLKQQPEPVAQTKPKAKQEVAPPPEPKYHFPDELKTKTVDVEVKQLEQLGPYRMFCGSFRDQDQADALKAKMAFKGIESNVVRSEGSSGVWFRVILGPYPSKRAAEKDKHALERVKLAACSAPALVPKN